MSQPDLAPLLERLDAMQARLDMLAPAYVPSWLTAEQYAEKEGRSPAAIRRMCREGQLQVVPGKRPWRILVQPSR